MYNYTQNLILFYFDIFFIWLSWVLVATSRIFDLHCGMWDLVP